MSALTAPRGTIFPAGDAITTKHRPPRSTLWTSPLKVVPSANSGRMSHADEATQELFKAGDSTKRRINALRLLSPFGAYLQEHELLALVKSCSIVSVRCGQQLAESPFYILITGRVAVNDIASGETVCVKHQGSFFTRRVGLGQITDDTAVSITTVIVGADWCQVLLVTSCYLLSKFYADVSSVGKEAFLDICSSNIGTQLNQVPFIRKAGLQPRDLVQLGEMCSYLAVPAWTEIFREGDEATSFYIILRGKVGAMVNENQLSIEATPASDVEVESGVRRGGETFGVAALVYNAPTRKYSMQAKETSLMLVISRDNFSRFLDKSPALRESLLTSTRAFLIERHAAYKHSIFHGSSNAIMSQATQASKFVSYAAGGVVYRRGDMPLAFYIVAHGAVHMAYGDDGKSSASDEERLPGQHFGEHGILLQNKPCIATVTCTEDTTLLVLEVDVFNQIFRSKIFELQIQLLLRLLGRESPVSTGMFHPASHVAFIDYALQRLGSSGLPVHVFNAIQDFLVKEKAARNAAAPLKPATRELIHHHLRCELANILRDIGRMLHKGSRPSDHNGSNLTARLSHALEQVKTRLYSSPEDQREMLAVQLLSAVDREVRAILQHLWPSFVHSPAFEEVLEQIGAFEDVARKRVEPSEFEFIMREAESRLREHGALRLRTSYNFN